MTLVLVGKDLVLEVFFCLKIEDKKLPGNIYCNYYLFFYPPKNFHPFPKMNILTKVPKKKGPDFVSPKVWRGENSKRSWLVNWGPHGSGTPRYEIKPNHKALSEHLLLL